MFVLPLGSKLKGFHLSRGFIGYFLCSIKRESFLNKWSLAISFQHDAILKGTLSLSNLNFLCKVCSHDPSILSLQQLSSLLLWFLNDP